MIIASPFLRVKQHFHGHNNEIMTTVLTKMWYCVGRDVAVWEGLGGAGEVDGRAMS